MEELFRLWTCLDFFIPFCSCYRDCHCGSYTRGSPPTDLLIAIISTNSHFVLLRLYGYTITHQFVVLVLHLATVFIVRVAILDIWVVKPHVHLSVHGNLNTSWALLWLPLAYSLMPDYILANVKMQSVNVITGHIPWDYYNRMISHQWVYLDS